MNRREMRRDQRGVSEVYGTLLIISFTFITAIFLIGTGWVLVGELTSETTDSLSRDSMRNVDRVIENVASESVNRSGSFTFPEGSAKDISASRKDGRLNLTITAHDKFWHRTEANASGHNQTGSKPILLGTIKHESEERGVTAYQGGALWRRPNPDGQTFLLSEPNIGVTDTGIDVGVVSMSGVETITEGSEVTVRRTATSGSSKRDQLQQFMSQYWTDRHNPGITVPVEINITIESQYADGWATYAEDGMGVDSSNISYPHNGDDETVKIALGMIGELPEPTDNPTFGDEDILYSGSSDLAYMYYNDTAGEIDGNANQFEITDPSPSSNYEVALYNESGRWLIYNTSAGGGWQDAAGNDVSPPDEVDGSVSGNEYPIHTPAELDDSAAAPVCVVTGSDPDVTDYIDEDGEDCLEHMVGIEEDMVGPLVEFPDFDVEITGPGFSDGAEMDVGESFNTTVEVENSGNASGQRPLGIYALNRTNWIGSGTESDPAPDFQDGILLAGDDSGNVSLDPGDVSTVERKIDTREIEDQSAPSHSVTGKNWTIFATSGGAATDVPGDPSDTSTVEFFKIRDTEAEFEVTKIEPRRNSVEAGENLTVEATIEETRGEISGEIEQPVTLSANGGLVNATDVELGSNDSTVAELTWQTQRGDTGTVSLEASTFDDSNATTVTVTEKGEAEFEVDITDTNSPVDSPIKVGEDLTVDATIENTGDRQDVQKIRLNDFDGNLVDWKNITLASGESVNRTFTWTTVRGDAGQGEVSVVSNDDSDSTEVKIEEPENRRNPVDVMFVLDETGSMGSYKHAEELTVWDGSLVQSDISIGSTSSSYNGDFHHQVLQAQKSWSGDLLLKTFNQEDGFSSDGEVKLYSGESDDDDNLIKSVDITAGQTEVELNDVSFQDGTKYTIGHTSGVYRYPDERRPSSEYFDVVSSAPDSSDIGDDPFSRTYGFGEIIVNDDGNVGDGSYTVQEDEAVVFEDQPCDDGCQADDYDDSEWFIPGETVTVADWDPSVYERISIKKVADESSYCDTFGCYDPYGDRIKAAQAALSGLNETLGDRAGALEFDTSTNTYQEVTNTLVKVDESLRIAPGGGTDIALGIKKGEEELADSDIGNNQVLIVLTDGEDNAGGDPVEQAKQVDDDIPIYTVGFGGADIDTLQKISDGGSGEGKQYFADDTVELSNIFAEIVDEITKQSSAFEVDVQNANTPVQSGNTLEVDVEVTNVGETGGERIISLENTDFDGTVVDTEIENLSVGNTATVTLEWDTTGVAPGSGDVTVVTQNDTESTSVTVEPRPEADLKIASFDPADTTRAGNRYEVRPELKNQGDAPATDLPVTLTVTDQDTGNTVAGDKVTVDSIGRDERVALDGSDAKPLRWDIPSNAPLGDYDLEIDFAGETQVDNVTVQPGLTNLDVSIANTNDPVIAGEKLDVVAEVENTGSETKEPNIVLKDAGTDSTLDIAFDVEVPGGDSKVVKLTWATRRSDGAETDRPVRVEIANTNKQDDTDVTINEGVGSLDAVAMGQRSNPLNIDLSEVEISS